MFGLGAHKGIKSLPEQPGTVEGDPAQELGGVYIPFQPQILPGFHDTPSEGTGNTLKMPQTSQFKRLYWGLAFPCPAQLGPPLLTRISSLMWEELSLSHRARSVCESSGMLQCAFMERGQTLWRVPEVRDSSHVPSDPRGVLGKEFECRETRDAIPGWAELTVSASRGAATPH